MLTQHPLLRAALNELNSVDITAPATLQELDALKSASELLALLLSGCAEELRASINAALGSSPQHQPSALPVGSAQVTPHNRPRRPQSNGAATLPSGGLSNHDNRLIVEFWNTHKDRFVWHFLPNAFLYTLYSNWLAKEHSCILPLARTAFIARLKRYVRAEGAWSPRRLRPQYLMDGNEPLVTLAGGWDINYESYDAIHGLLRTSAERSGERDRLLRDRHCHTGRP